MNRISKTEGGTQTRFLYDGERVQAEYDSSWNLQAKYTLEGDSYYAPALSMRRSNATSYYMLDALGSVRKLTDSNQTATDSYSYEAFGSIVSSSGSTTNPYRYVGALGYYRDTTSALLHLGARYYNSTTGRFLTRDPVVDRAAAIYAYAVNRPTRMVDPMGLGHCDCDSDRLQACLQEAWVRYMDCIDRSNRASIWCVTAAVAGCAIVCLVSRNAPVCLGCLAAGITICESLHGVELLKCSRQYGNDERACYDRYCDP